MPFDFIAALLVCLAPVAIATTAGLWLILLGGFGLPIFVKRMRPSTNTTNKFIYLAVLIISWGGAVILLADFYLWLLDSPSLILLAWDPLLHLTQDYPKATEAFTNWWTDAPLVWTVLAIEGPLVLLVHFGTSAVLKLRGVTEDHGSRATLCATGVMLLMGIITGLLGFGWPLWAMFANLDSLWEHIRLGLHLSPLLLSLCPVNLLLSIGLSVWFIVTGDRRMGPTAEALIAAVIAVAATIAGAIGVVLSILYTRSI
jgi:hypothetical protein